MKYYVCGHCGNIIEYVKETGVPVMCCGQKMTELVPGTSDGAQEKHVPVVTIDGDTLIVEVGAVEHLLRTDQSFLFLPCYCWFWQQLCT